MRRPASSPLCQESIDTTGRGAHTQVMEHPTRADQPTPADRDARRDAIVEAACAWAGAMEVLDEYRAQGIGADELAAIERGIHARHGTPLLEAVAAYLRGVRGEGTVRDAQGSDR